MRISQRQKQENREQIIKAMVDLVIEKGFKAATMRDIARRAGIADATIYNYFPTKDAILFAYYHSRFQESIARLRAVEEFNSFTVQEQLQTFFETMLELFLPDREFVQESFRAIFLSLTPSHRHIRPIQALFFDIIDDILQAAVEAGEIPEQMFRDLIDTLFWDYFIGIVFYWLRDSSEQFSDTSVFIDKSMDLACAFLKAGLVNKVFDITSFLFKTHLFSRLGDFKTTADTLHRIKREFTGGIDGRTHTRK